MPIKCALAFCEAAPVRELLPLLAFGEVPAACGAFRMMLEAPLPRSKTTLMRVGSFVCPGAFGCTRLARRRSRRSFSDAEIDAVGCNRGRTAAASFLVVRVHVNLHMDVCVSVRVCTWFRLFR